MKSISASLIVCAWACLLLQVPSVQAQTIRCGKDWGDANGKCGTKCTNDGQCSGEKCFKDLKEAPCKGGGSSSSSGGGGSSSSKSKPSKIRCGKDYSDANGKCGTACTGNAQCPSGESCFKDMAMTPCMAASLKEPLKGPGPKCTGNKAVDDLLYQAHIKDVSQITSSDSVYSWDGFCEAAQMMEQAGFPLQLGGKGEEAVGAANIASLLAQCMWESGGEAPFTACDENNYKGWKTSPCTQRDDGQLYHSLVSSTSCKVDPNMKMVAETYAKWTVGPMECTPNTQTAKCCWWGRGAIQTTGPHNYGQLQLHIVSKVAGLKGVDICKNPEAMCQEKQLKWLGAMYYWSSVVQNFKEFAPSLAKYVGNFDLAASKEGGADFAGGCGAGVNNGAWSAHGPAHGNKGRVGYFDIIMAAFKTVKTFKGVKVAASSLASKGGGGGGGGGGGSGETGGPVRCGKDWSDAHGRCGTKCANNGDCPSGEQCFKDLKTCKGSSGGGSSSSSGGGSSSSSGGSCTVRCGKDWGAANGNCGTACTADAHCKSGETCFKDLKACKTCSEPPKSSSGGGKSGGSSSTTAAAGGSSSGGGGSGGKSSGSSGGGGGGGGESCTVRCGKDFGAANGNCGTACVNDGHCPFGESCFKDLKSCKTCSKPKAGSCTVRCGKDWSAANSNCGASCTEDAHCKSGETCYKDLKACKTCSPPPAPSKKSSSGGGGSGGKSSSSSSSSTNRCGTDYPAANKKCGTKCTGNEDCPSGEKCYNNLDEKVCKTGGPKRCGTSYTAANAKCGTRCVSNTDCTSGEKCYNNLDEKVCKSVSINGELILGENTLILSAACCKNPSIIAGIAFAIMMQCIWDHI